MEILRCVSLVETGRSRLSKSITEDFKPLSTGWFRPSFFPSLCPGCISHPFSRTRTHAYTHTHTHTHIREWKRRRIRGHPSIVIVLEKDLKIFFQHWTKNLAFNSFYLTQLITLDKSAYLTTLSSTVCFDLINFA